MTVSYSRLVANGSSFGCFWKILKKWRGSVYKLVWREVLAYLVLYFLVNLSYRYAMNEYQQRILETFKMYFEKGKNNIPISFVLGFYVTLVVRRWWEQYRLLPWPDTLALFVSAAIPGAEERGRLMRRTIVRYAVLAYVITLKHVSIRVKKRFPTLQHMVDAGLMMESEKKIVDMMDERSPMAKYWMPLVWATNIINRARQDSLISNDHIVQTLLVELSEIRRRLGSVISYDTVCVPIVYTQVVTLSVYTYFLAAVIGEQMIPPPGTYAFGDIEIVFPIITVMEIFFYVGWLKVAEVLIGPFGEDDDDIELNWLIDRHIKAAYMIVDEMHEEHPELLKDQYWDEVVPKDLPYTVASEIYRREEPKGSAEFFKVKAEDALYANISNAGVGIAHRKHIATVVGINGEETFADYESVDTPVAERRKNNWLQRQWDRMSSKRSSATTYSSGRLFGGVRGGLNTIYGGQPLDCESNAARLQPPSTKMSLYDRIVGRKSTRNTKTRLVKANGTSTSSKIGRPRIPTPDVTESGLGSSYSGHSSPSESNTLPYDGNNYNKHQDEVAVQFVLSPIQEMDGSLTNNNSVTSVTSLSPTFKLIGPPNKIVSHVTAASLFFPAEIQPRENSKEDTTSEAIAKLNLLHSSPITNSTNSFDNSDTKENKLSDQAPKRAEVYV